MDLEIRYLLHGQKQEYTNQKPLYIMSNKDNNYLWFKIANQVLSKNNESWRLIDSELADNVPQTKYSELKLEYFTPENVIKLLKEEGASLINANQLTSTERKTLLTEIGKDINNKDLWKQLPLHENTNADLVSIKNFTYLENSRYPLNPKFKDIITLIKPNDKNPNLLDLQTRWINVWDSNSAMEVILNQPNPSNYCDLILNIWKSNSATFKQQYEEKLKETSWLILKTGENITPQTIIRLPKELAKYTKKVAQLGSDYYCEKYYSEQELQLSYSESNSISKLFERWYQEKVIEILLSQESPSDYIEIIIDVLQIYCQKDNPNIPYQTLQYLRTENWLIAENSDSISPAQVIDVSKFKIEREATEILESSDSDYVTVEMLDSKITQNETVLKWLKQELFITGIDALKIVGKSAGELPDCYLGEFNVSDFPLEDALEVFEGINLDILPCWSLVEKATKYSSFDNCQQYILPYLFNSLSCDKTISLLNWIAEYKGTEEKVINLYNQYLEIAVQNEDFYDDILPDIRLLNCYEDWKSPNQLSEYIDNIDESYLLNEDQQNILISCLNEFSDRENEDNFYDEYEHEEFINEEDKYRLLKEYFRDWQTSINDEAIGAFLCLISGNNNKLKKLAQEFLLKRDFEDVRTRLIGSKEPREFEISIQPKGGNTKVILSLTGELFTAEIKHQDNFINFYLNKLDSETTRLEIVSINTSSNLDQDKLAQILKNSINVLIKKVYCVSSFDLSESFDDVWKDLTESEQLDIQVTRGVILDSVHDRITTLGVHRKNEKLKEKINEINKAIQQREDYRNRNNQEKVRQQEDLINQLKQNLGSLLEEQDSEIASATLEAVRHKIGHQQFGYDETSIPFEIFQNADDALAELEDMGQNQPLPESRLQFILNCAEPHTIMMMYWGRPINCFVHPDYREHDYTDSGYDKDLQKMLSFSYSDKSSNFNESDSDISVTGKFGLGFKSVHLICREPYIRSHRLNFKIVGGLLPSKLTRIDNDNFDYELKKVSKYLPYFSDGTIIKLQLDSNINQKLNDDKILNLFENWIGLLLIFAKKIKTCKIIFNSQELPEEYLWKPEHLLGEKNIEIGRIKIKKFQPANALCLKLGNKGHFLMAFNNYNGTIKSSLNIHIPNIWVTAPTQEKLELNFIINAQFEVNTGRTTIINSPENDTLARELGKLLGEQLCKLFELSHNNWDKFQQFLNLENISQYQFWEFIWQELGVKLLDKPEEGKYGLIRKILGTKDRGIGYFLIKFPALPNGLSGEYQSLVSATEVKYVIKGIIKQEKYFNRVFEWIKDIDNKDKIIDGKRWEQFKQLLNPSSGIVTNFTQNLKAQSLYLVDILQHLIKQEKVKPKIANKIGKLVNLDFLYDMKSYGINEYKKLIKWLPKLKFLSIENSYQITNKLLNNNSEDNEEKLLSAFAPPEYLLSDKYDESGLAFFLASRQEEQKLAKNINVDLLTEWIENVAEDSDKKQKVIEYILLLKYGQIETDLVEELCKRFDWIKNGTQLANTTSIPETNIEPLEGDDDDSVIDPDKAKKYGEIGEEKAEQFYKRYYQTVKNWNHTNPENPGFDLECFDPKSLDNNLDKIQVEVKAITYDRPYIRITQTECDFMVKNKDNYELFIYSHEHGKSVQSIRIKKAWLTIKKSLESLQKQKKLSHRVYDSKKIESVIGLQQNSDGIGNDILLHWHRLFRDFDDENIEKC